MTTFHPLAGQPDRMSIPQALTLDTGNPLEGSGAQLRPISRADDTAG